MGNSFLGELLFRLKKSSCELVSRSGKRLSFRRLMHPERVVARCVCGAVIQPPFPAQLACAAYEAKREEEEKGEEEEEPDPPGHKCLQKLVLGLQSVPDGGLQFSSFKKSALVFVN